MADPSKKKPRETLGVNYRERKHHPPPGLVWRKVKDGETLGTIADEYHVRATDLMLYNWYTLDPQEINWYLYNFVGCRKNNERWYSFSSTDKPGMILVPEIPKSLTKDPPQSVNGVRNGAATLDSKLEVFVIERLASGGLTEVLDKWLYVFSGDSGIDFGSDPPPPLPGSDAPLDAQPGSAFKLDFPGVFYLKEKPTKLEYEILITNDNAPSHSVQHALFGKTIKGDSKYKDGENWYVLSDSTILQKATSEGRETRTTHAFRNSKTVLIDLTENRRYYFLLSPVQLGPQGIMYAMNNPMGLTPLLKPNDNAPLWDPASPDDPYQSIYTYIGPTADDIKTGIIMLPVIDPYAWAESVAEEIYRDHLEQYIKWVSSTKNTTIKDLEKSTGWETLDHLFVAQILKSVRDSHPDPGSIDDELKDAAKWKTDLETWETGLIKRNAEINAAAHRSLIQLIEWLKGPAHQIVDTAILEDTTTMSPADAIDIGWSILHWALCTEQMIALEPGMAYLKDVLLSAGSVPYKMLFQYMKDLDKDNVTITLPETQQKAFHYGYQGVLKLLALRDFISPSPVPLSGTREQYREKLAQSYELRRANLIKLLNDSKILNLAPLELEGLKAGVLNWTTATAASNAMLDFADKFTTYVIEPDIKIAAKGITRPLAWLEGWFNRRPSWVGNGLNLGSSYGLKGFSFAVSGYNLIMAMTTARYDYQKEMSTVSTLDWASMISGSTLAVQDVLMTMAAYIDKQIGTKLATIFPELTTTGGKFVQASQITGIAGRLFAGVNVLAMFVSGVTTVIAMSRSSAQAYSRGDYTAATFYDVGALGGVMMTTGAVAFGWALMEAGGSASATGVGATVGVVLFFVGGLLAAIGTFFGWLSSSDDYQVFARKCFLGNEGSKEPRFGSAVWDSWVKMDPPDWSLASKNGKNTWPIDKQKQAIYNLLGRFTLKTSPFSNLDRYKKDYQGGFKFVMSPGLFPPGSSIELALHYGVKGPQTSARILWEYGRVGMTYEIEEGNKGDLFDTKATYVEFEMKDTSVKKVNIWTDHFKYEGAKGELLTTVTVRYPDLPNVIRARKLVIGSVTTTAGDYLLADGEEVTSGLFE